MSASHSGGFPLAGEIYITARSALDEWKSARALLADTIASYLAACATLRAVCTAPSHQSIANSVVEEALVTVDSELGSLESNESALHDMRTSLATMRNHSSTLAPINSLPPEILARIFALARAYCVRNKNNERHSPGFASACAYWQQIALDSTDLWTHIDVNPAVSEERAKLLLRRTKDSQILVHVHEPDPREGTTPGYGAERTLRVLTPHMHRVHTLDIESYSDSRRFISRILNLWLASGNPSLSRSLIIYRPHGQVALSAGDRGQKAIQDSSENAKMMLQSLNTLHLENVKFDWHGGAYRGLVDLRLSFACTNTCILISHLAKVLSTNPKLVVLKLGHLTITHLEGQDEPAPIALSSLKVLNLIGLEPLSLKLLLPLILIPSSSVGLGVGLSVGRHIGDEQVAFLARRPVTTLYCVPYPGGDVLSFRPSLLGPLPYVSTLVLHQLDICGIPADEANPVPFEGTPSSHPPRLILVSCAVTFGGLKELVSERGIQKLHLERCRPSQGCQQDLHGIRISLLELYPEMWCCISDIDSTSQLPCRTMFDH